MNGSITSLASSSFGISNVLLYFLVAIIGTIASSITVYFTYRSFIASSLIAFVWLMASTLLGFLPFWTLPIAVIVPVSAVFFNSNIKPSMVTEGESGWLDYGNRLKNAYSAKFGGVNNGFNQEVDSHIAIMEHCRAGFTKALAKDWLKRMERFTESK